MWENRSTFLSTHAANAAASRSAGPGNVSLCPAEASKPIVCCLPVAYAAPPACERAATW